MAILTGAKIIAEVRAGRVLIEPFDPKRIGPNSYDMALGPRLRYYDMGNPLDPTTYLSTRKHVNYLRDMPKLLKAEIPENGLILYPGRLYLGTTVEYTETPWHVPYVDGRSSAGRLGMQVHLTAGRGDIGFRGHWTLEITVVHPLCVYPGDVLCQLTLMETVGPIVPYQGKYQDQPSEPIAYKQDERGRE